MPTPSATIDAAAAPPASAPERTTTPDAAPARPSSGTPLRPHPPSATAPPARNWAEYRHRAAQRLVDANPDRTYTGPVHEPLLAIPVLTIDLHADGSVQRVTVLRPPHFAKDTLKLAEDAVRRAAPFGPVGHLPKPWRLTETFLFDEARRFKPRTLDE